MIAGSEALEARVDRLEKQNRRLKWGVLSMFVFGGSVLLMAQAKEGRTVRAQEFLVEDSEGRELAALGQWNGGPQLQFHGPNGKVRLSLSAGPGGAGLVLWDGNRKMALALGNSDSEGSFLRLGDPQGFQAQLGVAAATERASGRPLKTSAASLILFGKGGKVLWSAP